MKAQRRRSSNVAPLGNGAVGIERTMFLHKSRSHTASQSLLFITFILSHQAHRYFFGGGNSCYGEATKRRGRHDDFAFEVLTEDSYDAEDRIVTKLARRISRFPERDCGLGSLSYSKSDWADDSLQNVSFVFHDSLYM
jgi:hypothetical protein